MSGVSQKKNPDGYEMLRGAMVSRLRGHYGIKDERVLEAMAELPRHRFVPPALVAQAYKDGALPIANRQTISQPFIVARMTELLELTGTEKVLEVGAGTGYQTAVLASLARKVFAVERLAPLAHEADQRLKVLGFRSVELRAGDGTAGWATYGPYDAILVAAGSPAVPEPLKNQLAVGGRLIVPVGESQQSQVLVRVVRTERGFEENDFGPCVFVPLIGEHGWKDV